MKRVMSLMAAAAVVLLVGVSAATAEQSYSDPAGDAVAGPDITAVTVANDAAGTITVDVTVPLTADTGLGVFVDTNVNGSIDEATDRVLLVVNAAGVVLPMALTGEAAPAQAPSLRVTATPTSVRIVFAKADVAVDKAFAFAVATFGAGDDDDLADLAPDDGLWPYILTTAAPPVVKPVIGKPVATPAVATAGRRLTVTFPVTRSDTGARLTTGRMICDPSVAGRVLRHAESFTGGKAKLSFLVPKAAKGKLLKVKVKIVAGGQSATRIATYRIR